MSLFFHKTRVHVLTWVHYEVFSRANKSTVIDNRGRKKPKEMGGTEHVDKQLNFCVIFTKYLNPIRASRKMTSFYASFALQKVKKLRKN